MNTVITAAGPGRTTELGRWAVPLICVAQLMATLDVTIVNLALPALAAVALLVAATNAPKAGRRAQR